MRFKTTRGSLAVLMLVLAAAQPGAGQAAAARFIQAALVTISPVSCPTGYPAHPSGYCYSPSDCQQLNGTQGADCASGYGSCCFFSRTCGGTTITNVTSFVHPSYLYENHTTEDSCQLSVEFVSSNICQLRLDLNKFLLSPPDKNGTCVTDVMTITGTSSNDQIPRLCGYNDGQHLYVDVDPEGSKPVIMINTTKLKQFEPSWNILITQIECNSPERAPDGCLQYHTEPEGFVQSFNYKNSTLDQILTDTVSPHLSGLDYSVCLASRGSCGVTWTANPTDAPYSFMMTGNTKDNLNEIGKLSQVVNTGCADYVTIPNGEYEDASGSTQSSNTLCGLSFPNTVISTSKPLMLRVVTDNNEVGDNNNAGFNLHYNKTEC